MASVLPVTPPVISRGDLQGSVKALFRYAADLQEKLNFALTALQRETDGLKEVCGGISAFVSEASVTEKSGEWSWRKYSDGSFDLWGYQNVENISVSNSLGGWYQSGQIQMSDLPFVPIHLETALSFVPGTAGTGASVWQDGGLNGAAFSPVRLIRPASASGVNGKICLIGHGIWK